MLSFINNNLTKAIVIVALFAMHIPFVHSGGLDYQNRGNRWEGIAPHPVAGSDIELLSALVHHRETWQPLPPKCKMKFYLQNTTEVALKVQELRLRRFYKMDRIIPKSSLQQGFNELQWPTNAVIEPLHLDIAKLGAVARLQSVANLQTEHVAPVLLYHTSAPTSINGYRFAFKVADSAKLSYAVYQGNSRQPLLEQELGKQTGGTPFVIFWDSHTALIGNYKLVVKGYFLDGYRKIRQDVHFYHQPIFDSASQVKEFYNIQPPVQVTPPNKFQQQPNIQSAIERYPTIKCPDKVKPGQKFPVVISLTKDLITSQNNFRANPFLKVSSKNLHSVSKSTNQEKWEIEVVLSAPNFAFHSPETMKITISHDSNSTEAPFVIAAEPIQKVTEQQKIEATLWLQGAYLTRIVREITVTKVSKATQPTPKQADTPSTLQRDLQSPDMTVRIQYHLGNNPIILIHSNKLPYFPSTKKFSLPEDLSQWLNDNYGKFTRAGQKVVVSITNQGSISQLERERNVALMKGFGRHLYDKYAPQEFKKAFWALKDKLGNKFDTIHIFTDDPIIPWELMIPNRGNEELDFLGIDFQIARWHISEKQELDRPLQSLDLQKLFAIMPEYPDDNLTMARNELEMLQTMTGFRRVGGNYNAFSKLFKTSTTDNSIIHFSGHGIVQDQRYAIKLEDGELDLMTFRGIIPRPPKTHPLFFFNACDIGQAHHVANFVDGWAPTVLEAGASGYIGGLWPLTNIGATKFAELFYQQLEKSLAGQPTNVADILRQTRKHFYDNGDPTFLGYVYYGDPHFRLVR